MAQLAKNEARERERERQRRLRPAFRRPPRPNRKRSCTRCVCATTSGRSRSATTFRSAICGNGTSEIGAGDQIRPGQNLTIVLDGDEPLAAPKSYTVKRGDTLSQIATRQGVTTKALGAANNLTAESTIYPGMTLKLPQGANGGSAQPTATSCSAAKRSRASPSATA
jgi:hypothetical protein